MKPRVLVVHGDPTVARSLSAALRGRGFDASGTGDFARALEHDAFDVLVAARELGRRTGFDLIAEVAAEHPAARAVVVAREPDVDDYERALAVGARAVVADPVALDELQRSIEVAFEPLPALPRARRDRRFRWSGSAGPRDSARAVRELLGFLLARGLGPTLRARIGSAATEALENAWEHGYFERPGPIHVEATVDSRDVVVEIRDQGTGFDVLAVTATAFNGRSESGLARAAAMAEDLRLESTPASGTSLTLTFGRYGAGFDDSDLLDLSDADYLPTELARRVHSGRIDDSVMNVPPALAVVIGRLLSGPNQVLDAMRALWG